jgi:pimeloyl-ACP methyl ester carboxylesterase
MFTEINDHRMNVVSFGAGPRTFVAHGGWVGSWEIWQQPFEQMSATWRCISYDHRGAGESVCAPEAITPDALVDDLFAVLNAFEVERCVLAGESLGCAVALAAVTRDPSRFDGLVLVDGSPSVTDERVRALIDGARADYPATVAWFVDACTPEPDCEHIRRWGRHILLRANAAAAARMFECYLERQIRPPALDRVSVPTLVIHGSADAIVPMSVGRAMSAAIPNASFVALEGAGHVPTMTRAAEVVAAIETKFPRANTQSSTVLASANPGM